jgi:hypothetical protein
LGVVRGTAPHGLGGDHFVALAGRHDDGHIRKPLVQCDDAVEAVVPRHAVVYEGAIKCAPAARLERLFETLRIDAFA